MNESVKIWKDISSYIEAAMSTVSYEMWFGKLVPLTIENNKLIMVAPLVSVKKTVDGFKNTVVRDAIEKSGSYVTDIIVITEEEAKNYKPEKETFQPAETKTEEDDFKYILNPSYTFDNFVVGDCNNIASSAAKAVAENPGVLYNPLFIYGGVGLGKTHILHAIGNYIHSVDKTKKILYVTSEQFVNEFIDSLSPSRQASKISDNKLNKSFREKYRNADVLMIDDVQFLSSKMSSQEALFHTFNDLYQNKKQIVLSSDRHPKELTFIEERLQSRFQCGLTVDITNPSVETRVAILKKKAELKKFSVSNDVLFFIAENISSNVRELEGALSKVFFFCSLEKKEVCDIDTAREALKDYINVSTHVISIDNIVDATCTYYNIKRADIVGKKKMKNIALARQIAIYLINDILGLPLTSIASYFGKDHTTVMYARDKITSLCKSDKLIQAQVNDIKAMIQKK